MRIIRICLSSLALLSGFEATAVATTIISSTGPLYSVGVGIFSTVPDAIPFTLGKSYSDLEFDVDLIGYFNGTAYLMNQIGPGTTIANQIATSSFTSAASDPGSFQLVMNYADALGPGTYYLVLATTQNSVPQGMQVTISPTIVANDGSSVGHVWQGFGSGYPPVDSFSNTSFYPEFVLTGTVASVPEPTTWSLLILGTVALLGTRRRSKHRRGTRG
jgi:hypothetical protein